MSLPRESKPMEMIGLLWICQVINCHETMNQRGLLPVWTIGVGLGGVTNVFKLNIASEEIADILPLISHVMADAQERAVWT